MADDYALTHKMSSKSGNPRQKRYHGSGNRENISRNTDFFFEHMTVNTTYCL